MDKLYGSTLYEYKLLQRESSKDIENEIRYRDIILRMLQVAEFCHDMGILIRNLSTKNIALTDTTKRALPRIINLDNAMQIGVEEYVRDNDEEIHGDLQFISPERLKYKPYGFKSDIWSIGVISFFLLTSELPFQSDLD